MKVILNNTRSKWTKIDIALFSRVHANKYGKCAIDVTDKYVARRFIRPNKDYAFFGIYNNDRTKVKNIFTGEIFVCGNADNCKCSKGGSTYTKVELSYNFFESKLEVDCNKNCDLYIYSKNRNIFDKVRSWGASVAGQLFTSTELKQVIKQINLGVHEYYMSHISDAKEYVEEKAERLSWRISERERDF